MDLSRLEAIGDCAWRLPRRGKMRVPAVIYATPELIGDMDDKVGEQITNVASLPGIVGAAYAMPDAHWGYGFPIGGVAAFDPGEGGIVSAGGVGFDISCGVRLLRTGLCRSDIERVKRELAEVLYRAIPAGVGSRGKIDLDESAMTAMLAGGARWAVEQGYGRSDDLACIEESGCMPGARPDAVSQHARERQRRELGTLGSGNHYLEVQVVDRIDDERIAAAFGLAADNIVVSVHCGSRGLGHQIGTEFLREMAIAAPKYGIELPDLELACAPIESDLGRRYLGAMRAAVNCALANRQVITHLAQSAFARLFANAHLELLFDVSHNVCREEKHVVEGERRRLFVHRKGATRAFGPGDPDLPQSFRDTGQPVFIGGSMGTASYVMTGIGEPGTAPAFASACHGAGRSLSRHQASKRWHGRRVVDDLAERGILVRSPSLRGVAEEAPGAYKDVGAVVNAAHAAGLARKVARLAPLVCIKG